MLEYYLTKKWISELGARLMAALPSHHAAMRCVSLSSVALRVFSFDRSVLYERVVEEPRSRRTHVASAASAASAGRSSSGKEKERRVPLNRAQSNSTTTNTSTTASASASGGEERKRVGRPRKRKINDYEDDADGISAAIAAR